MKHNHLSYLPRSSGVYRMRNKVTGDVYIGASLNIRRRCVCHSSTLAIRGSSSAVLNAACKLHGRSAFEFDALILCAPTDLQMYEDLAIKALKPTYNQLPVIASRWWPAQAAQVKAMSAKPGRKASKEAQTS
jgi:group I intron endonuclease